MTDYQTAIMELKAQKDAVILAHYYQRDEIQEVADYIGDSLYLSQVAKKLDNKLLVFCGVHFMAETAKILSPEKKVLLPDLDAGCPMADMVNDQALRDYKEQNPEAKIICYVNSTAAVKALSDVCVTSTNAKKIAQNFVGEKLLYVPDQNLGNYLNEQIPGLNMDLWPGHCCIHNNLKVKQVDELKAAHPEAQVVIHPEANPDVVKMADFVGSTKALLDYVTASEQKEFIVGTECGILYAMRKQNPDKKFYLLTERLTCRTMKLTTIDKVYDVLKNETNEIIVEPEIAKKAYKALDLMLELS